METRYCVGAQIGNGNKELERDCSTSAETSGYTPRNRATTAAFVNDGVARGKNVQTTGGGWEDAERRRKEQTSHE